jgi:hypothetical protein
VSRPLDLFDLGSLDHASWFFAKLIDRRFIEPEPAKEARL